ncbi:hypothetical protein EJA05_04815 [Pseudomonas oryziphila]|uniref:Uncharacterized protein n=1 Tax=Pseudomonas entomophila TaxID=312306 RepID=A0A3Q8TYZ8_9PSED|nr:hypothetical protein EJA05_04815 [Pseudomonas oryziphila]
MWGGNNAHAEIVSSQQGGQGNGTEETGPKQTVGAGLPAKRRAGGARSHRRCNVRTDHQKIQPKHRI